ncbi:restriction endonuclease subunit S [Microbacterium sp. KSW4-16]|uniref:restriction endonuclease subunit S n=1 Tax=Microbacterium aurugineum TaxID=2851642 RepID=UPI0020BE0D75|nr:restriction endonuclease subunit S [Microbacterium aurugineum]MCK8467823.1 restriction endonuclease subunit S [Microbacterium aurugineum]
MRTTTLGEIAEWGSGGTPKRAVAEYFGKGTPWLSIADLNDGLVTSAKESLTPAGIANSSAKIVPEGTIFVAMYGSIGKLGIAGAEMATSQAIAFAKPEEKLVDTRFLFQYLLAQRPKLQNLGRGGTQMNIGQGDLKAWPIPLPQLPEQRRIASILDQADAIRTKRRQVLAHLDSLAQAIFRDMFGDLSDTQPLSELVTEFRYGTSSRSGPTGNPTLRIPNIVSGGINHAEIKTVSVRDSELSRLVLRDNDLLFVRTNGNPDNVGRCAVFTQSAVADAGYGESPWIFASYLIRARLRDGAAAAFVATFLTTPAGRKHLRDRSKTSAGQYNINIDGIGSVPVPVSDRARQVEFSARIEQLDSRRARLRAALAADNELFASLQSRAFRGEL